MKEDWIECEANLLGDLIRGINYKKPQSADIAKDNFLPILRANNINENHLNFDNLKYVEEELVKEEQKILSGDIIFAMSSGSKHLVGKSAQAKDNYNLSFGAFCSVFRPNENINSKFIQCYFHSSTFRGIISKASKGSNINNLKREHILNAEIPLPPLPIQKTIVKKIEELFSSLDSGIADLKKAQNQLVIYRQAVLSSCFPKNKKIEISELVDNLSQGWSPKCINQNSTDPTEWAVIKTSAIQAGKFVEIENKILPDTLEPREQHEIKKGDILITRAGPRVRVGICCLVKQTRPKLINCDKVYRIGINQELVTPEYFEYALNSPEILSEIEIMKSGSSDSGLNLTQKAFLKLEIPICSKEAQHQIVSDIESRLSVCDTVEKDIADSLEKAQALRQSILKKAFEGKLLSEEEIAACKAHPEYEPAGDLLERIKAEKLKK
ncbi:hypothetical protein G5B37_04265 [Rasiella rasia]|uniref:Type I restriction modification DNA specificity domain-containing protein n=1 Tax=Rasiella rasia TaxID=2744027 RepID=A0A6G6GJS5_9FLAO|nr:restriction endonuclease subunit S [Rasiella rasia]QIE58802.1 hypothetical protein G5B37_04265 [Rasiella rasia]